jgi:curved DNA-binding protein CbpA
LPGDTRLNARNGISRLDGDRSRVVKICAERRPTGQVKTSNDAADTDRVRMPEELATDYYEVLQISPNADPDTVHRVYRFHPDNQSTGDSERFRLLTEAYHVLGDPEQRAEYDVHRPEMQKERSKLISHAVRAASDVQSEKLLRLTILELLYARRRTDPQSPGIFYGDLESLVGCPQEHIEFALWYLAQRKYVDRSDGSQIAITADGCDHLESNAPARQAVPRLTAASSRKF